MTAEATGRHIGLGDLVVGAGPEYAESLVGHALEFRRQASRGARTALDRALDRCVRVNGFRDASKAPSASLKVPVLDALVDEEAPLASALLGVWAESRLELRDAVGEYLDNEGGAAAAPDLIMAPWNGRDLEDAVQLLVGRNEHLDEHDVRLMFCYVSGRDVIVDLPGDSIRSPMMRDFLAALDGLDPSAPDWEDVGPFLDAVADREHERSKRATDTAVESLVTLLDEVLREFEGELAYLDLYADVSTWADEATDRAWLIGDALAIVEELHQELEVYRPVRPQADTRVEEAARAAERVAAEDGILEVASRWRELMQEPIVLDADEPVDEDDLAEDDSVKLDNNELREEIEALRGEVHRLRQAESERKAEHEGLAKQRDGLVGERESLQSEVTRLDAELSSSREMVEIWRLSGVSARLDEAGLPAEGWPAPRTVRDAVALAGKLFPDRLAIALNSKSDNKRSQFQKPQEVFDALAWLATAYHQRRGNPGGSPDFDKLLKESCPGWSYKSSQTEITREQFEEWYTTIWEGRRYDLSPHLGKGISYDPQNTIRIAFDWDDDRKRVVVGYIGMHQRNRKS